MWRCRTLAHLQVHKRWVQNLEEEFFRQGDAEKRNDLPVSALFDREKPGVTKSQVSVSPASLACGIGQPCRLPSTSALQQHVAHWLRQAWCMD
jgi:hypothetical protein